MRITAFVLFMSFSFSFGQKSYEFDTLLEYECRFNTSKSDTLVTQYIYTNSKDNSYYITVRGHDKLNYSLEFADIDNYHSVVKVLRSQLFNSNLISIDNCKNVHKMTNRYKSKIRNYAFTIQSDTIISSKTYKSYTLKYLKSKRKKKKNKIGTNHYIIKNNTEYHLPILTHPLTYNEWKKENNIPNGIYKEYFFYNHNDKITNHHKLKKIKQVAVKLNLVKPCPLIITVPTN